MIFRLKIQDDEYFWGGEVASGTDMPISKDSKCNRDFRYDATK